jgi:hypothetical protein
MLHASVVVTSTGGLCLCLCLCLCQSLIASMLSLAIEVIGLRLLLATRTPTIVTLATGTVVMQCVVFAACCMFGVLWSRAMSRVRASVKHRAAVLQRVNRVLARLSMSRTSFDAMVQGVVRLQLIVREKQVRLAWRVDLLLFQPETHTLCPPPPSLIVPSAVNVNVLCRPLIVLLRTDRCVPASLSLPPCCCCSCCFRRSMGRRGCVDDVRWRWRRSWLQRPTATSCCAWCTC